MALVLQVNHVQFVKYPGYGGQQKKQLRISGVRFHD